MKGDGLHLRAIFGSADEGAPPDDAAKNDRPRRYQHELATYRLDRMLGLDFVPVTVGRKVDKQKGALQLFLEGAVDLQVVHPLAGGRPMSGFSAAYSAVRQTRSQVLA